MSKVLLVLSSLLFVTSVYATPAGKVAFSLGTTTKTGSTITQSRYYYVYRPAGLPLTTPVPAIVLLEDVAGDLPIADFNALADSRGLVIVTGSLKGNSSNTFWTSDDPQWVGPEDYDYISSVINQVKASQNCNDFFVAGLGQGGRMALAYACERSTMIKAAACVGGFMEALGNVPQSPVPVMMMHGTGDTSSVYAMARETAEIWRTKNDLLKAAPYVSHLSSPLALNSVVQTTWAGGKNNTQVAFVSIKDGSHAYPIPSIDTGFDGASAIWAFMSQYMTPPSQDLTIVSPPLSAIQLVGQPATFSVSVIGQGPYTYRWQKNGTEVIGATGSAYTTPLLTAGDNGAIFSVVVMNRTSTVTSSDATVTVQARPAGPSITTSPAAKTVVAGQPVTFSVVASTTGIPQYQWQRDGMPLQGAITSSYTLPTPVPGDSGACFRVLVTDGSGTTTSARAVLNVTPAPRAPIIITNPMRLVVQYNRTAPFTVNAWSSVPMTYQWQKGSSTIGTSNFVDIVDAVNPDLPKSPSYSPPSVSGNASLPYRCIVSNAFGSVACVEYQSVSGGLKAPAFFCGPSTVGAQTGVPFVYSIMQRGATVPAPAITYDASPLPAGLTIDHSTGVISGIPSTAGSTRSIVVAYSSAGTLLGRLTINVGTTPPPISITAWRAANFGASALNADIAGDSVDADNDGHPNLLEYATGTNPLSLNLWSGGPMIVGGYLTQSVTKNPNASGITWGAEISPDLRSWSSSNVVVLQNTTNTFKVRDKLPCSTGAHRFLRVNATLTGPGGL